MQHVRKLSPITDTVPADTVCNTDPWGCQQPEEQIPKLDEAHDY